MKFPFKWQIIMLFMSRLGYKEYKGIMNMVKNIKQKNVLAWLFFFGVLSLEIWFFINRGAAYIDSDMAGDIIGGQMMLDAHNLFLKDWWYSTGIDMFGASHASMIGLSISPQNWVVARMISSVLLLLLMLASYLFIAKLMDFDFGESLIFATLTICPIGYLYFEFVVFGLFYIPNAYLSALLLGVVFVTIKSKDEGKFKYALYGFTILFLGIILGISGVKFAIFPVGPLLIASLISIWLYVQNNPDKIKDYSSKEFKLLFSSIITAISFIVGIVLNLTVIKNNLSFEIQSYIEWGEFSFTNIMKGIFEYLSLFGYQFDNHIWLLSRETSNISCFSLQGVANLFGIMMAVAIVFSVIRVTVRYKILSFFQQVIVLIYWSSLFTCCVMFNLTRGYDACTQYWAPIVPLTFLILQIEITTENYSFINTRLFVIAVLVFSISFTSVASVKQFEKTPIHANPQLVNIANLIEEKGYKQGYASFWQADALSFLTNGNVDVWTVFEFNKLTVYEWLQNKSHANPPTDDRIFALIGPDDNLDRENFLQYMDPAPGIPRIVYQDEYGYILVEYNREVK